MGFPFWLWGLEPVSWPYLSFSYCSSNNFYWALPSVDTFLRLTPNQYSTEFLRGTVVLLSSVFMQPLLFCTVP